MNTRPLFWSSVIVALAIGACGRPSLPSEHAEPPTLDVTHWTDTTELFMEYPALVSGRTSLFAVHLTTLADFAPVKEGRARIEFTPESGGQPAVLTGPPPSRPGAFRLEDASLAAGRYRWALVLDAPGFSDRHDLGTVTVFADLRAAIADRQSHAAQDDPTAIAYLKEQQWTNPFATAVVRASDVRTAIRVPAVILPLTGGEAVVAAPAAGRFSAASLVSIGDTVRAGQSLGTLEPRLSGGTDRATLVAEVAEARAATEAARAEAARAERLLADRAVPARRVEEAGRAVTVADARLRAAEARLAQRDETLGTGGGGASGNAFVLRAPISGRVAEVSATLGAAYDEGAPLFKIVRTDQVELQALVPAAEAPLVRDVASVALEFPGRAEPLLLRPHHMHNAGVIDTTTRALAVQFSVDNPGGALLIGQTATAMLYTGARRQLPVVPKDAVLMEAGRPYVFVQISGERFARRFIDGAVRDGDLVGLSAGVRPGDRVVIKGAYEIQLTSAAKGLPAEGHVH